MPEYYEKHEVYLKQIAADIHNIRGLVSKAVNAIHDAESEVSEKCVGL